MPAFSHFFLKRLSARSKFSSSWIMTSDKFYFPPSWRLCAGLGQTDKLRRHKGMGQAKPSHSFRARASLRLLKTSPVRRRVSSSAPGSRSLRSERSRLDQASVARRRRKRTDCRSWVVAYEDTRRLPFRDPRGSECGRGASLARGICSTRCMRPRLAGRGHAARARHKVGISPR
jgi:hypothetical protein